MSMGFLYKRWKLFCNESDIHGLKYINEPGRPLLERSLWVLLELLTGVLGGWLVITSFRELIDKPVMTMHDQRIHGLDKVPFPTVTICNNNRLSAMELRKLAKNISSTSSFNNISENELFGKLKMLGFYYDMNAGADGSMIEPIQELHEILIFHGNGNGSYDITAIMKSVTPKCSDTILACKWNDVEYDCGELIPATDYSMEGPCCNFNNKHRPAKHYSETKHAKEIGYRRGLSIVLNPDLADYAFTSIPSEGIKIMLSSPGEFADRSTGSVTEKFVSPNREGFIMLTAHVLLAEREVTLMSPRTRRCYLDGEAGSKYYTYGDCLLSCRIRDIISRCQCLPFHLQFKEHVRVCDLGDLPCLGKYKAKWTSLTSISDKDDTNDDEKSSLICRECLPSCSSIDYMVQGSETKLRADLPIRFKNFDARKYENLSILHIYFGESQASVFLQKALVTWYDILSNFGSLISIFAGASIMTAIEFIYLLVLQPIMQLMK